MNPQPADTRHLEMVEVFKLQPAAVRGRLLYRARWLADSPSQPPHARQFNAVLVREFEKAEREIQGTGQPPEIPVLTWGDAFRLLAPPLKLLTIGTVGFGVLYGIGAVAVGLAKGAHAFAVASGGWVFGAAVVYVLCWAVSKIEWARRDEAESEAAEKKNQNLIINVFTSQNGDVSVNRGNENK